LLRRKLEARSGFSTVQKSDLRRDIFPHSGSGTLVSSHDDKCACGQYMSTLLRIPFDRVSSPPTRGQAKPPKRILVVDDEAYIRRLSAEVLLHSGYHVDVAENGAAAWDALQLNSYDLLVTDDNMCRLTGIGLVKKLHAARMTLPVILVSRAMPTEELNRHPWLQIPAKLLKPFSTLELLRTVRHVLCPTDSAREQIALNALKPLVSRVGAAVRARVGEKVARSLEAQTEGGGEHRLPHHGQLVQHVLEIQRETDDQQRCADFKLL
jgi:two-component system, chemotaxis family, chemotaxis protein CheY